MPKKTVPKKNVEPVIVDVRKPNFNYERLNKPQKLNLAHIPRAKPPRFIILKRTLLAILFAGLFGLVAAIVLVVINLQTIRATVTESSGQIISNFASSASALKSFEPDTAVNLLQENDQSFSDINNAIKKGGIQSFLSAVGNLIPMVSNAFGFLGQATNLNITFLELAQNIQDLETNGFKYFQSDGQGLLTALKNTHTLIQQISEKSQDVKNSTTNLKSLSPLFGKIDQDVSDQYLKYSSELFTWDKMLVNLTNLLGSETDRHILVFFQNPSEVRPGGGFIGSYADITVNSGQMKQMDVHDIYDPDGQLALKVIPPEQLQTVTTDWGARDANWFFDFPTSAKTVIRFMEASKMYSEKNVTFDAAIALNINVVNDLLSVTGPIQLTDYNLTIDQNNLLEEVQRSVEAGADKKAGQPKKILMKLAPILLQKLNDLSTADRQTLFDRIKERIAKKDIMLYAKDPDMAAFLSTNDLDGSVYEMPNNFWGTYLAVANANVAGGKSDAFVDERVTANVDVDTNGNTFTNVQVARTHNGNLEKDPWWKATNNDFMQIFAEPNSTLVAMTGNDVKPKYQTMDYTNSNYMTNPDLAATEKGEIFLSNLKTWLRNEFGKNVFATWLLLPAGQTKTLNVQYQTTYNSPTALGPGQAYTFIFERQAGVKNSLDVTVNAPFKYYWAESNDTAFHYTNDDPDKRTTLTLTLKKKTDDQQ
ncbi:MAG: DUF4012 domain-containing protein [Minisyncoccia bacterium]|jgi:hypothetical protein